MRHLVAVLLALLLVVAAWADESPFRLADLQWNYRVLLVFAPDAEHEAYQNQRSALERATAGMEERDLLWVALQHGQPAGVANRAISPASQEALRTQYGVKPSDFVVILIGRDGGLKLRKTEPVDAVSLFVLIDSMPMRRNEMRRQSSSRENQ